MILYLGLSPSKFPRKKDLLHYPVIRTEKLLSKELLDAKMLWPNFTHAIFTSQTAVRYWQEEGLYFDKKGIAVGSSTADALREFGIFPLVALQETQEGIVDLLETIDLKGAFLFWPRSKKARPFLEQYLQKRKCRYVALDLYDTIFQKPEPVPSLADVEEIVFTSPSTVHAFLKIYGVFPKNILLTAIGPVTRECLESLSLWP